MRPNPQGSHPPPRSVATSAPLRYDPGMLDLKFIRDETGLRVTLPENFAGKAALALAIHSN